MNPFPHDALPPAPGLAIYTQDEETTVGRFLGTDLSSVFQPIIE